MAQFPMEAFEYTSELEGEADPALAQEYRFGSAGRSYGGRSASRPSDYRDRYTSRPSAYQDGRALRRSDSMRRTRPGMRPVPYPWPVGRAWPVDSVHVSVDGPPSAPDRGEFSEFTRWVQSSLNQAMGLQLPVDGAMNQATHNAIHDFQRRRGLPADGYMGPDTRSALIDARRREGPSALNQELARCGNGAIAGATAGIQREAASAPLRSNPPPACKPEPGEVAASRTAAGILTKDVEITDKGVLVTDFGIDRRSVKGGAKSELASLIHRFETDPLITEIWIHGFSDCIGPGGAQYHTWLRRERARRVRDLLGPVARAKVKFVGPAPLGTFNGPNTDRAGRARNRSVLIEFRSEIIFEPEPPITAPPCHEQLIRRALRQLCDGQNLDSKIKTRLGAALGTSLAGRDDSFIRPGSTSWMFPFRWSGIGEYFRGLCNQPGGAAALSASGLARKLMELDQDIINGLDAFNRAKQQFFGYKMFLLRDGFGQRLEALLKNKAHTIYAEY